MDSTVQMIVETPMGSTQKFLEENYWKILKSKLEKKFHQQEILIIHSLAAKL